MIFGRELKCLFRGDIQLIICSSEGHVQFMQAANEISYVLRITSFDLPSVLNFFQNFFSFSALSSLVFLLFFNGGSDPT